MSIRMAAFRVAAKVIARCATRRPPDPVGSRRVVARLERLLRPAAGVDRSRAVLAGVPVLRLRAAGAARGTVLHLHGGAYTAGSPNTALALSGLVPGTGAELFSADYRLAPEHPFPAALEDALAVYEHLTSIGDAERIVVVGESSGGGLALALLQRARDDGLPLPAAVAVSFPWVDLTLSGASLAVNEGKDILSKRALEASVELYAAGHHPADPGLSPLFGSFHGFPETLIVVGLLDVLLDDSRRLATRMGDDGVTVQLKEWPGCMHGFTGGPAPEGREASTCINDFILDKLAG